MPSEVYAGQTVVLRSAHGKLYVRVIDKVDRSRRPAVAWLGKSRFNAETGDEIGVHSATRGRIEELTAALAAEFAAQAAEAEPPVARWSVHVRVVRNGMAGPVEKYATTGACVRDAIAEILASLGPDEYPLFEWVERVR